MLSLPSSSSRSARGGGGTRAPGDGAPQRVDLCLRLPGLEDASQQGLDRDRAGSKRFAVEALLFSSALAGRGVGLAKLFIELRDLRQRWRSARRKTEWAVRSSDRWPVRLNARALAWDSARRAGGAATRASLPRPGRCCAAASYARAPANSASTGVGRPTGRAATSAPGGGNTPAGRAHRCDSRDALPSTGGPGGGGDSRPAARPTLVTATPRTKNATAEVAPEATCARP